MARDRRPLYQKRDRLRQLQAFCYAAKLGSMTRAAEQLLTSQPAVSLHVRELEHELETVLFERKGPRIALSPAGERFYEIAHPLVEGMDSLAGELARALENLDSGEVRVASGNAGALHLLPRALKRLRDDHPGIRVHLSHCVLAEGLDLLLADDVELVFGIEGPVSTASEFRPVLSYELVLIVPPDHPLAGRGSVTPEEIAACPMVVPQFGTYGLHGGESPLRQLGVEPSAIIEAGGWDLVEQYVEAGLGVAICPSLCVTDASRVAVVPLRQHFGKRSYGWFMQIGKPLSWPAQRLVEAVGAEFPGNGR